MLTMTQESLHKGNFRRQGAHDIWKLLQVGILQKLVDCDHF